MSGPLSPDRVAGGAAGAAYPAPPVAVRRQRSLIERKLGLSASASTTAQASQARHQRPTVAPWPKHHEAAEVSHHHANHQQDPARDHVEPVAPSSPVANVDSSFEIRPALVADSNMTTVENFSRPRKPSPRSQPHYTDPAFSRQLPTYGVQQDYHNMADHAAAAHQIPNNNYYNNLRPRARGLSGSSAMSSSTYSSIPNRPSNDQLGLASRTGSLRRANPNSGALPRSALTYGNNGTQAYNREMPPWLANGDELRSSFRSQLTTSTAQGTLFTASGTERSSVLTKASSITEHSIINGYARASWRPDSMAADDGPSLEDVMGMYERGFNDSDIESIRRSMRFADDDDDELFRDLDEAAAIGRETSRPPSSHSDISGMRAKMLEAMNDPLPITGSLAIPRSSRANNKRESRNNFRKSLMPSSLPKDMGLGLADEYIARRTEPDTVDLGKHDSAKMLDGDDDLVVPRQRGNRPPSPTIPPVKPSYQIPSRATTPAPNAQFPSEPQEEPDSRDRYGFRKASVNVTRQQYDAWDASYTEYLARRRKKWVAFLKDNSLMTDQPNRFPPRSAKAKRFVRKGIPPEWRGAAWFYYAGGPAILSKHRGVYDELVRRAALNPTAPGSLPGQETEVKPLVVEDIEKDLHRTFPDNARFKPPPQAATRGAGSDDEQQSAAQPPDANSETDMIASLRRVLHAFALYNPRIGYCQSLNFIAGLLLLFVETEEQAFWLLNVITRVYLPGTHEMSLEGSKVDLGVLMLTLKDSLPGIWKQIGGDEVEVPVKKGKGKRGKDKSSHANDPNRLPAITLCMTAWFMSCFIGTLPTETVLRVWDVFFYEGSRTLFRIALTIFKLAESEIKAVTDPMEMFGVVQAFPRRLIDCNALMESCYKRRNGIGHLSQEVVEEKRQERRAGIRKWKAEQEGSADGVVRADTATLAAAADGLDLAGDLDAMEARRKGTLFGRKKDREQVRAAEVM
ncbi:hypothetical protein B0H63DRAFT_389239 [Podospora didyma]|uniref:Rab-GAP TBC domain-containing protein n=1 Tax=Podospora didyma TaxID=330526 RepID=A0AAE0U365_9PEZI|nr:hypothetical protein B0H63DRAFT_389239 [Podospora didyma]